MHCTTRNWTRIGLAVALTTALHFGAPAYARERLESTLRGGDASRASGRARVLVSDANQGRLEIKVRGLAPNQSFDVLVGDVKVGTLRTTGGGQGGLRFRSRPRGRDLLLGFDPRGALITLRDAAGVDVLLGSVPAGSRGDAAKVACCIPDDRGAECEDRSAEECAAQGGTPTAATSCLPNPCADAPPVDTDVICCVPDDSGPECEDRSVAECMAQGGTVVGASSCAANPCSATPPAEPEIQCCVPDDRGAECEDRTAAQCAAQGGIDMGPGTCSPDPCAGLTPAGDDASGDDSARGGNSGRGRDGGEDGSASDRGGARSRPGYYGSAE